MRKREGEGVKSGKREMRGGERRRIVRRERGGRRRKSDGERGRRRGRRVEGKEK